MSRSALPRSDWLGCGSGKAGASSGGLQIWEGYTGAEATAFKHLLAEWNKAHPTEKVTSLYVNNDNSLPKLLTAVKGGSQPDIAYVYGSWAPNVAQIPQVVNLTKVVQQPKVNWNRLLGRRARRSDRQRRGHRHSRAGRQPGGRLQQDALRQLPASSRLARTGPGASSRLTPRR